MIYFIIKIITIKLFIYFFPHFILSEDNSIQIRCQDSLNFTCKKKNLKDPKL